MEEWLTRWTPPEVLAALGLLVGAVSGIVVPIILLRSNRKSSREAREEERAAAKEARSEEREEARRRATEAELQRWRDEARPVLRVLPVLRALLRA